MAVQERERVTNGITFFNFGGSCVVRLFVALHSLRKFYRGPITVFLARGDRFNERIVPDLARLDVDFQWFDMEAIAKKNMKCVLKPKLFLMSPYTNTLMMDGDMLFQGDPSVLFMALVDKGFLVTRFSTWNTDGPKMRERIQKFRDKLTDVQWAHLTDGKVKVPAVNIGVMGWSRGSDLVMERWESLTLAVAGQHMADEHAAQVTFPFYQSAVVGPEWNESCVYPANKDLSQAKVLHYHGGKHSDPKRPSSRRWLRAFQDLLRSREVVGLGEYMHWGDDAVLSNTAKIPGFYDPAVTFTP